MTWRNILIWKITSVNFIEQIGPSVSISANARIGAGARLKNCIILDDVEIKAGVQLIGLNCISVFGTQNFHISSYRKMLLLVMQLLDGNPLLDYGHVSRQVRKFFLHIYSSQNGSETLIMMPSHLVNKEEDIPII